MDADGDVDEDDFREFQVAYQVWPRERAIPTYVGTPSL